MADDNSIVDELKEAFKDLGIPETSESTQGSVKPASSFDPKKINEVIFLEKLVVDPERLNGIREIISKWSNNIPHHDLTNLGEKIEIVSATENPSYIIELQTLYEQRTLKRGVKPFRGEKLSPKTITEAGVDIWVNPTADEKDFKEEKKNYIIDGSSEVLECEKCDGAGEFICGRCGGDKTQTCPGCNGEGEVKCRKCGGEGTIKCSSCSGNGQIKCSACGGKGSILCPIFNGCGGLGYKGSGNNKSVCIRCKGAGRAPCTSCGARGHKPCSACGSRGYKQCDSCKNGYKTCEKCNRRGIVTCGGCSGRGIVICSLCEGKKSVIKFLYYEDIFSPNVTAELVHSLNQPLINSIVERDKKNAHAVVDITQAEISGNIFDTLQHDAVKQNLTKLLVASKTVSSLGAPGTDYRILKQRIAINKYDIIIVNYRHLSKSYSLLIHGTNTKTVYVKTSPIHQLVDNYLTSAGQLFKQKEYSQAFDLVEKILNISPEKAEAKDLKKQLHGKINMEYKLGATIGGVVAALMFILGSSLLTNVPILGNTWWDTVKVFTFLSLGFDITMIANRIFTIKYSTKIKETRKRIFYPFFISLFCVTISSIFIHIYVSNNGDALYLLFICTVLLITMFIILRPTYQQEKEEVEVSSGAKDIKANNSGDANVKTAGRRSIVKPGLIFIGALFGFIFLTNYLMSSNYTDNGNGTVTALKTGLIWQKEDDNKKRDWKNATAYCRGLTLAGYTDWRLPSFDELMTLRISIYRHPFSGWPAIETNFFPDIHTAWDWVFWSSTPSPTGPDYTPDRYIDTLTVDFGAENARYFSRQDKKVHVRCVRGGQ